LTAAFAIIRQCTYRDWSANGFLGQTVPFWGPLPEWVFYSCGWLLGLSLIVLCYLIVRRAALKGQVMPLPALPILATGFLIFVLNKQSTGTLWLYVPAFYHGSQYLVISTAYYLNEKRMESRERVEVDRSRDGMRYYGFLLLAAGFIYVGVPRFLQE